MNSIKKYFAIFILFFSCFSICAQYKIEPEKGFSTQIGYMVNMMENSRKSIIEMTKDLNQEETDFLFDDNANSIGAIIMHMAATESYFQVETLEGRTWTDKEAEYWSVAISLSKKSRDKLKGKPIQYYLDIWAEVRKKTLEGLKTKDDAWFATITDDEINNHYAWFHILDHSANHMGQIGLVKNRFPKK